jgi:hypothetical protein
MKTQSILLNISLIISTGCLAAGYLIAGYWMIVPALLLLVISWVFSTKRSPFWLAAISLLGYVILAAVGIVVNLSLALMIIASTIALVNWELIQFKHSTASNSQARSNSALENYHLRSLALAASSGLALALFSSFINLQLPFGVVALLVLIAIGGIVFGFQHIIKKKI